MLTFHIVVKGKVQGVFYRASAKEAALDIGITGWVRNMPDGNVEMMARGTTEQLHRFTAWCKTGPSAARVEEVVVTATEDYDFSSFNIVRN